MYQQFFSKEKEMYYQHRKQRGKTEELLDSGKILKM